jgi:hypothetical protein
VHPVVGVLDLDFDFDFEAMEFPAYPGLHRARWHASSRQSQDARQAGQSRPKELENCPLTRSHPADPRDGIGVTC